MIQAAPVIYRNKVLPALTVRLAQYRVQGSNIGDYVLQQSSPGD